MKTVLAFGDSNTWGLVPGSKNLERFPFEKRWTGILQSQCPQVHIIEEGLCGRTTVFEDSFRPGRNGAAALPMLLESHFPLDGAILMLGTNDCKMIYGNSAYSIGKGIEICLDELERFLAPQQILLVSPIWLNEDVWQEDKDPEFGTASVEISRQLKAVYQRIAAERGTNFFAASDYARASSTDAEHMNAEGHRLFASALYQKFKEMKIAE